MDAEAILLLNKKLVKLQRQIATVEQQSVSVRKKSTTQKRFLENWVSDVLRTEKEHSVTYLTAVNAMEERLAKENACLEKLHQQLKMRDISENLHSYEIRNIKLAIQELSQRQDQICVESQLLSTTLAHKKSKNISGKAYSEHILRKLSQKLDQLKYTIYVYQDLLGMTLYPVSDASLCCVFKHIDELKPAKEFRVTFSVVGRRYIVTTCTPFIPEIGKLKNTLAAEQDILMFLKNVRVQFKFLSSLRMKLL